MLAIFAFSALCFGQRQAGELRVQVVDASGASMEAALSLTGAGNDVRKAANGSRWTVTALPFGVYALEVSRTGFAVSRQTVEIRSEVPRNISVTLGVAPVETALQVVIADTLLNPDRTGATQQIGSETLRARKPAAPAREIISLVDMQPGWLLEANGVLHPRGSEYGVQYVVDGMPVLDNRSPVYAPMFDIDEAEALVVRTGGFPAEFGHMLGGVVELTTSRDRRPGWHGRAVAEGGSFSTERGAAAVQYGWSRDSIRLTGTATGTDRYLDPPTQSNFTNRGSGGGVGAVWDRDWSASQRTRIQFRNNRARFLVPNEDVQQLAGQRQDRTAGESAGQAAYTAVLSPRLILDIRGTVRDVSAGLWSNALSTPIAPTQSRGFRESYATAGLAGTHGAHNWKVGGEALFRSVQEDFGYRITAYRLNGVRIFDRDLPATYRFLDRRQNREQGAYVQDHVRLGSFTLDAGVRWDHYRFVLDESAFSPRVAAAWRVPHADLVLRASYDRVFQSPALENLLLASSAAVGSELARLPVRPSRGDYFEAGFSKSIGGRMRLDGSWFRRTVDNFADDSLLLNTGVSFPIAFAEARIQGFEAKLDVPRVGPFSGFLSYTNMHGLGRLPVAGGLFLGDDVDELLGGRDWFAITQDQRNTARAQVRWQAHTRVSFSAASQYGSGLPVELEGGPLPTGPLVSRVNLARGRVRPNWNLDLSGNWDMWKRDAVAVRLGGSVLNVTDRLNVINFSGLFSGTAVAPGRWGSMRLAFEF